MLVGQPKTVILDRKHYYKIRKLARSSHLKIYEAMHEIIDQHFDRMNRLEELNKIETQEEFAKENIFS